MDYDGTTDYYTVRERMSYAYYDAEPGDMYGYYYNNYAFKVLGLTLELASGSRLDDILDERIFEPLGIDASFASGDIENTDLLATLYDYYGEVTRSVQLRKELILSEEYAVNGDYFAGGLTVSAADLAKLAVLLSGDGEYEGERLMSEASVAAMEECEDEALYDGSYQAKPLFYAKGFISAAEYIFIQAVPTGFTAAFPMTPKRATVLR